MRSPLNSAGLKMFNPRKLALLVPEGESGQHSAVEPVVDAPPAPLPSRARCPPALSQLRTQVLLTHLLHCVIPQANASEAFPAKFRELCVASDCLCHCKRHM